MLLRSFVALFAAALAGCAAPAPPTITGTVVQAKVTVNPNELSVIDWITAAAVARQDGVPRISYPGSSAKPTSEELQKLQEIEAQNERFAEYVVRPDVLLRAQAKVIPEFERKIVNTAQASFNPAGSPSRRLRMTIKPINGVLSQQREIFPGFGSALESYGRRGREFIANVEMHDERSGALITSRRVTADLRRAFDLGIPSMEFVVNSMLSSFLPRGSGGPVVTPTVATSASLLVETPPVRTDAKAAATQAVVPNAPSQSENPAVPVPVPLFEGTSYALFTPQQISAYCAQSWTTRTAADGRTEYNPCTQRSAFAP